MMTFTLVDQHLTPAPVTDGRRRRSQDSRERIVRAMLELVHAGDPSPGAEQVAARAGVGLRSVFRHFADMDSLYREMSALIEGELRSLIRQPFSADDWRGRTLELIERRAAVYERIGPFLRASETHRHRSPFLEADHTRFVSAAREILRQQAPEAARNRSLFEALDLLLSFETWSRLRREQGLSYKRAVDVLEGMVKVLTAEVG